MRNREREQPGAADLGERLQALERRFGSLQEDLAAGEGDARLAALQSTVADLAAAQRDFQAQLKALVDAVEKRLPDVADEIPEPRRTIPPPAPRGRRRSWAMKALRFALRGTLGVLRRAWDATRPNPPWGDEVRLRVDGSGKPRGARLGVVARSGAGGAEGAFRAVLERQTDHDVEVVAGTRETSERELEALPEVEHVWCATQGLADLSPTFLETVKLLLAVEDLPFVFVAGPAGRPASAQWIVARELWHPETLLDLRALEKRAKRFPDRVLGKGVGGSAFLSEDVLGTHLRHRVRPSGPYFVPANPEPRIFEHPVSPPPTPSAPVAPDRPAVMMLASVPLTGGLARTVAAILDRLAAEVRWLVASTAPQDAWSRSRFRKLEHLIPGVYALADFFAEESLVDVLAHLISRHGVERILHLGGGRSASALQHALSAQSDLRVVGLPLPEPGRVGPPESVPAADDYLAVTREIDGVLRKRGGTAGARVWRLPWVGGEPSPPAPLPEGEGGGRLRRELGLPSDAVVVTMWSDLVAEKRPEDFAALAHRFRDDPDFRFLLVGDGPLSASVRDIESYFGLRNFVLEAPRRSLAEYLDATDVFCTTAEQELFPHGVLAALDRGRPVVAAAVDDLGEILEPGPSGVVVPFAGDLDGFESAIRSLSESGARRQMGERARRAAAGRRHGADLVEICRRALGLEREAAAGEATTS